MNDSPQRIALGSTFAATVTFEPAPAAASPTAAPALRGGLIVSLAPDEFLIAGSGIIVTFAPTSPGDPTAGILSAQEGNFVGGRRRVRRWLNGDQTHQGRHIRLPAGAFTMQRVKLYRYR